MHSHTNQLRSTIITSSNDVESLGLLRDAYVGETAYILCCGKSFKTVDVDRLRTFLQHRLVMSVKQTYEQMKGIADFHIYNTVNLCRYEYADPKPIRIVA